MNTDFKIDNNSYVWTFEPITEQAKLFTLDLNSIIMQWIGSIFFVNEHYAQDVVFLIERKGMLIQYQHNVLN
jgi:hypothetical protein